MKVQSTLVFSGLLSLAGALPAVKRDSAINEPAVAAPNGVIETLSNSAAASLPTGVDNSNSNSNSNCMSGNCNSNSNSCMSGDCGMNSDTSMAMETSTMMMDTTTAMNNYYTTSVNNYYTTSTAMAESSMMTEMATNTYAPPPMQTYGSGYMPSSYDSCVQQCVASYGAPPSMVTATASMPYSNGMGSGATHTVIVAPTQGVLRYVPFAVNASVGDTVRFMWNAGPHTVTKSSALNLCNATSDSPFKSGMQNKSFVFDQVVNDTNPTFYYCGVTGHCEKGMFGIINPPNGDVASSTSVGSMMPMMAQNNSDFASQWSYTMMNTNNSTQASNWGSTMDVGAMTNDPVAQMALLQNVMFTRLAMASNDKFVTPDGGFNPDLSQGMAVPMDPLKLSAANGTSTSPSGSDNVANSPNGSSTTSSAPATSSTSGARRSVATSASAIFAAIAIAALVL